MKIKNQTKVAFFLVITSVSIICIITITFFQHFITFATVENLFLNLVQVKYQATIEFGSNLSLPFILF
jgi:hypothetical protein